MKITPYTQTNLYGLEKEFYNLIKLYENKILPNKILLTGQKGIGKSTMAYHLVNYILSKDEEFIYDIKNCYINKKNRVVKNDLKKYV